MKIARTGGTWAELNEAWTPYPEKPGISGWDISLCGGWNKPANTADKVVPTWLKHY